MPSAFNYLQKSLTKRVQENSLRILPGSNPDIDFISNDYLGLARSEELFDQIQEKYQDLKIKLNGSTGSRLLSGNSEMAESLEKKLASHFKAEAGLIFNSGYNAGLSVLSSVPGKDDTIIYDELAHACIKDGARLSISKRFSFRHNDVNDLEQKLKRTKGKAFIVLESIYSMDGDQTPLLEIVNLAQNYDSEIILDEAHATGIIGKKGVGLANSLELQDRIFARIYTFGKAMGVHGAIVCGKKILKDYLINNARPFIYTTALPLHSLVSIECAFDYLKSNHYLLQKIDEKISLFIDHYRKREINFERTDSNSQIQGIIIPGNSHVRKVSELVRKSGYDVRPILSPTVKLGKERIRVCLHTFNNDDDILGLLRVFEEISK